VFVDTSVFVDASVRAGHADRQGREWSEARLTYTAPVVRQVIPRPPSARRIDPPIGLDLADPSLQFTIEAVREAFSKHVDEPRSELDKTIATSGAAVLIVLVAEKGPGPGASETGSSSVVLIRRASHLRANPGEIAFPGGRIEQGESPLAAALREPSRRWRSRLVPSRCWVSSR